nr:RNA-processing protein, HAT helix [Tanacetum cinerariifolium]
MRSHNMLGLINEKKEPHGNKNIDLTNRILDALKNHMIHMQDLQQIRLHSNSEEKHQKQEELHTKANSRRSYTQLLLKGIGGKQNPYLITTKVNFPIYGLTKPLICSLAYDAKELERATEEQQQAAKQEMAAEGRERAAKERQQADEDRQRALQKWVKELKEQVKESTSMMITLKSPPSPPQYDEANFLSFQNNAPQCLHTQLKDGMKVKYTNDGMKSHGLPEALDGRMYARCTKRAALTQSRCASSVLRATEIYGVPETRRIYEQAISSEGLPEKDAMKICIKYAEFEKSHGETDRGRKIYVYASRLEDPRVDGDFWKKWHESEVNHGNEDTFRRMLQSKRSVSARHIQHDVRKDHTSEESTWQLSRFYTIIEELIEKLNKNKLPKNYYPCINDPSPTFHERTPAHSVRSRHTPTWAQNRAGLPSRA